MPEVLMPRLDPGMQSGKIVEWLKKEGDQVQKGQAILVVEGEKTTFEIEAPENGVLTKILVSVGSDVPVSQPVAIIGEATQIRTNAPLVQPTPRTESVPAQELQALPAPDRTRASPAARRLAREKGVDLSRITGTGPGGRITQDDVLAAVQAPASAPSTQPTMQSIPQLSVSGKTKLTGIRRTVAERLTFSARTTVPVILTMEVDATQLTDFKDKGGKVGFSALAVKAAAKALEKNPSLNSTIEGEEITTYSDINVAVAINTDQGLVAPVIRNANKKSLQELENQVQALAGKAKKNLLTVQELVGATFTITNLGGYDVDSFAPVINPPQCAILGLGRITYKPFAVGEKVSAKPSTIVTLVFDHRIVDGVPAARFLQDIKHNLENIESLG
jgi:pyruvate dehydrogenase E2 component (dihydrolipoamide acetyltransferase)